MLLSLDSANKRDGLIIAKRAKIDNNNGVMEANLQEGKVYRGDSVGIEQIDFDTMILRRAVDFSGDSHLGLVEYWKRAFYFNYSQNKIKRNLSMYVLLSLFPLMSLFYFPLIGVKNPRYQKNYTIVQTMLTIGIFFTLMYLCATHIPLIAIVVFPPLWTLSGYLLYRHYVAKIY